MVMILISGCMVFGLGGMVSDDCWLCFKKRKKIIGFFPLFIVSFHLCLCCVCIVANLSVNQVVRARSGIWMTKICGIHRIHL